MKNEKQLNHYYHDNIEEFNILKRLIKITINTDEYNSLIVYGSGGLGKSSLILNEAKKHLQSNEFTYYNGHITPLSLYRVLYDNRDKKLLILDDIEAIFKNDTSLSILKSALWGEIKRTIQYNTSQNINLPDNFDFNANLIILINRLPNKNESLNALISRCLVYELKMSYDAKISVINQIIKIRNDLSNKQRDKVINIINDHTNITTELNFRLLRKLIAFVKEDELHAQELFTQILERNENKEIVYELMKKDITVNEQVREFIELTGLTRRTYFRVKKEIKKDIGSDKVT